MGGSREGGSGPTLESQVAIGFLRNTCKDPPQDAIGPHGLIIIRPNDWYICI